MPIVEKNEVVSKSSGPVADQVSQTSTVTERPTGGEVQDAHADRGNAWVWYLVGLVDVLLMLRFAFHLFGARSVGFADLLYTFSAPFVAPFRGIFPNLPTETESYFDTASLLGIFVYAVIGLVVTRLIDLMARPSGSNKL